MLVPAVGIAVAYLIKPDVGLEYRGNIYSVPVMIVNMSEWFDSVTK
jgi:hypothetical protein